MSIDEWWPRLSPDVREWLIAHNGEPLSPEAIAAIERAGGAFDSDDWVAASDPAGTFELSDDAIDWVEAVANEESPD